MTDSPRSKTLHEAPTNSAPRNADEDEFDACVTITPESTISLESQDDVAGSEVLVDLKSAPVAKSGDLDV